jgi:hypothetical protein
MTPPTDLARRRFEIARTAARSLLSEPGVRDVWLDGALAIGLAHDRSDIDLTVVVDADRELDSRVVDGVRVDCAALTPESLASRRLILERFDVTFDDIGPFRAARAAMSGLTRLVTARRSPDFIDPVVTADEMQVYRRWALADQAETMASLAEDFVGLHECGLVESAHVVWSAMRTHLVQADLVARGQPLLGAKWAPVLCRRVRRPWPADGLDSRTTGPDDASVSGLQATLIQTMTAVWPTTAAGPNDADEVPAEWTELPWMPQRYADGWFARLGDERRMITDAQLAAWCTSARRSAGDGS